MSPANADSLQRTVLAAAVSIVASSGPDDVSLREVARAAGVSHQAPYHHFKDREGLFAAITEEGFSLLADSLDMSQSPTRESMFVAYVQFALRHPGHFRVMFRKDICNLEKYPDTLVQADRAFGVLADFVATTLGESASVDEIRLTTTYMWSVAHGLATLLLDGPLEKKIGDIPNVDEFVMNVARLATRALS
ncbi:MAG: TetR/AcrR family transcriptional regulator [Actinobacteria bacterium]|nr:TetR/AcrR family transcriptional regulator [Actinomycetota bacterium]